MDDAAAHAAALDAERSWYWRAAAQGTRHPLGLALRDDGVARAHTLNMLWVTVREATADELVAALTALHGHLGHRKAHVDDDALGAALAAPMRERGYAVERHVYMALRRPRDHEPAAGVAEEVDEVAHAVVEAETTREQPHGSEDEVVAHLAAARSAIRAAADTRFFVGSADGERAAHATLLTEGAVAQLEDVGTLAARRGRGLARAVCSAAVDAAAGAGLVFVVADADDWPKELYAKLGFDTVGAVWAFTRDPA